MRNVSDANLLSQDYGPGNPQYHVDSLMEGAVHRAFENIWDDIAAGELSRAEAQKALDKNWDLGDYFDEWWEEGIK